MNVDYLLKNEITANEFLVLQMLIEKQSNRLESFKGVVGDDEYNIILASLVVKDFLEFLPDADEFSVTETALRTFKGKGYFEEFYMAFPVSVVRPDGKRESLRTDKKRCNTKYTRLAKRKDVHDNIMKCLEYEVKERTNDNSLMYMKKMPNWLSSETWKEYEEKMLVDSVIGNLVEEIDDGTNLI